MFVWAGKDVAYSESAGKLLCPRSLQQASCERKWNAKLSFCFLMAGKTGIIHQLS